MRHALTAAAVLLLLCVVPAARAAEIVVGESIVSALEKYRAEGVRLVYATGLVPDRYRVEAVPDPRASIEDQLRTLLEPHGLTVTPGADDIWVVVAPAESTADAAPVTARADAEPEPVVEEVLVTAAHHRLMRTPTPVQSLSSQELDNTPSAGRDLFRAVTSLPGQASDGLSARQKIRGGSENEVLYLVDGVQLIAPFHMDGFFSPFSALDANVVDAVDIYNAGYPTRFGTRSGGVLDLTLSRTDAAFSGSVDLNLLRAALSAQGAADNWQWLASVRRATVDYVLNQLKTDYGKPQFHDELVRFARETDDGLIAFGLLNSGDEVLLKNPAISEEGSMDRENLTTWAVLDLLFGGKTRVVGRTSYNRIRGSREGTLDNPVDAVGSVENAEKIEIYRVSAEVSRTLSDRFAATAGAEYQYHEGSFNGRLQSVYGPLGAPIQSGPGLDRTFDVSRKGNMAAAYASISSQLTDRLEMELGLRWDYQDIDPVHDHQWSPRLQVNFDATDRLRLFLNLGRYVQHQYLFEVPLDDGLIELTPPQLVDQLSVGAELYVNEHLQVLVETYGKRIEDPQPRTDNLYNRYVLLPEIHADRVLLMPEKARASGLEVSFAGHLSERLGWRLGYVYADVSERLFGDWRPRPWDQHHAVRAQLDWEGERWQASLHAVYHDGWATTDLVTDPAVGVTAYDEARLRDYVSIDASVSRLWRFQHGTLEAYLQVSNLFDRSNVGGYNYDLEEDGRWEGDPRTLLPVLPVLGIKYAW